MEDPDLSTGSLSKEEILGIFDRNLDRIRKRGHIHRKGVLSSLCIPQHKLCKHKEDLGGSGSLSPLSVTASAVLLKESSPTLVWRFNCGNPQQDPSDKEYICKGIGPCPPYVQCTPISLNYLDDDIHGDNLNFRPFPDDPDLDEAIKAEYKKPDNPNVPKSYVSQFKNHVWKTLDRNVQYDAGIIATVNELVSEHGMTYEEIQKMLALPELEAIMLGSPEYNARQSQTYRALSRPKSIDQVSAKFLNRVFCDQASCRKPVCTLHVQARNNAASPRYSEAAASNEAEQASPRIPQKSCPNHCFLDFTDETLEKWDENRLLVLKMAIETYPDSPSCDLSMWCCCTCSQFYLQRLQCQSDSWEDKDDETAIHAHESGRPANRGKDKSQFSRTIFIPCNHPGRCLDPKTCSCLAEKVKCEYECQCDTDCHWKYKGCNCACTKPGLNCCSSTGTCDCVKHGRTSQGLSSGRECDLRVCHGGKFMDADPGEILCKNAVRQTGRRLRTYVRESAHGYGLFMDELAVKGAFIDEYVGELLTRNRETKESVARYHSGQYYGLSVAKEWSINSAYLGNETRFINHSTKFRNLTGETRLVNGDLRTAFFAARMIQKGEELFFNYGDDLIKELR